VNDDPLRRDTITLVLELRVDGDTFTGLATDRTGAARAFSGWLGLVSALDAFVPRPLTSLPRDTQEVPN